MPNPDPAVVRAILSRVQAEAARLMVEHDDYSVSTCLSIAWTLELLIYGDPFAPPPVGILGRSPLESFRDA